MNTLNTLNIKTARDAKKGARAMEKALSKLGIELERGHALNVLASMAGFLDWNGLNASLEGTPVSSSSAAPDSNRSIWNLDFNHVTMVRVYNSDYTVEGWESEGATEVLHLATLNDEVYGSLQMTEAEFNDFKWVEDRQHFVNSKGIVFLPYVTAESAPFMFKNVPVPTESSHTYFSILDVDFEKVIALEVFDPKQASSQSFQVDTLHYPEALAWIRNWSDPSNENCDDAPVLNLSYLDDNGFDQQEPVAADELRSLKWDAVEKVFVNPIGMVYRFHTDGPVSPKKAEEPVSQKGSPKSSEKPNAATPTFDSTKKSTPKLSLVNGNGDYSDYAGDVLVAGGVIIEMRLSVPVKAGVSPYLTFCIGDANEREDNVAELSISQAQADAILKEHGPTVDTKKTSPVAEGPATKVKRYKVNVYAEVSFDGAEEGDFLSGRSNVIADNVEDASTQVLNEVELGINRDFEPRVVAEIMEDSEGGPFQMYVNNGPLLGISSFSEAYRHAQKWAKHNPLSVVHLEDYQGQVIVEFNTEI